MLRRPRIRSYGLRSAAATGRQAAGHTNFRNHPARSRIPPRTDRRVRSRCSAGIGCKPESGSGQPQIP